MGDQKYVVVSLFRRGGLPLYFWKDFGSSRWTFEKTMAKRMSAEEAAALCLLENDRDDYYTVAEPVKW